MKHFIGMLVNRASIAAPAALEKAATAAQATPVVTAEPAKALINDCQEPLAAAIWHGVQIVIMGADYHCTPTHSMGISLLNGFQAILALILTLVILEVGIAYNNKLTTYYVRLAGTFSASLIASALLWGVTGIFVAFATLIGAFLFWAICSEWFFVSGIVQGLKYLQESFYSIVPNVFAFLKVKITSLINWIKSLIQKPETDEETPPE
jgi:hypothetical protein